MNALGDAQTDESVTFVSGQTLVTSTQGAQHQPEQSQAISSIQETTEQNVQGFQPQPDNTVVQVHPCVHFIILNFYVSYHFQNSQPLFLHLHLHLRFLTANSKTFSVR